MFIASSTSVLILLIVCLEVSKFSINPVRIFGVKSFPGVSRLFRQDHKSGRFIRSDFWFLAGDEGSQLLGFRRDEEGGAMFREHAKPRAGVEKFLARRRKKYS